MNRHLDWLDTLCSKAEVQPLSAYIDYTDQAFNYGTFDDADLDDADLEPELDPETGLAYGINDMTWFDAAEGLAALQAVRDRVAASGVPGMKAGELAALLEELDDCLAVLAGPAARGGKFHLSLVE